jgi:hypothetical protein
MADNIPTYEEFLQSIADRNPRIVYWEYLMQDDEKEAKNLYVQHLAELGQKEESQLTVGMPASHLAEHVFQLSSTLRLSCIVLDSSQLHLTFDMKEEQFPTQHNETRRDNDPLPIYAPRGVKLPRGKDITKKDNESTTTEENPIVYQPPSMTNNLI